MSREERSSDAFCEKKLMRGNRLAGNAYHLNGSCPVMFGVNIYIYIHVLKYFRKNGIFSWILTFQTV